MKVLFISRAYPPTTGGLEEHNYQLSATLSSKISLDTIANKKGRKALPIFLPYILFKVIHLAPKYDLILLGDGVLAIAGWINKIIYPKKPVVCILHGLDITYRNRIYQFLWIKIFIQKINRIITVSQATKDMAIKLGINENSISTIPNGIKKSKLNYQLKIPEHTIIENTKTPIIITIGRLVKRKGINWLIKEVIPYINKEIIYVIAGDGPEKKIINKTIKCNNLSNRVINLGFVDENYKNYILSKANLFIQPNIKVPGDMEGFGISVLEANLHGLPVLGSNLEGLKDSITENKNGWLIEPENKDEYINAINKLCTSLDSLKSQGKIAKHHVENNFSWDSISDLYIKELQKTIINL